MKHIVQLNLIPEDLDKIIFCANIHEAIVRHQNFGQVSIAFIIITYNSKDFEVFRFDL